MALLAGIAAVLAVGLVVAAENHGADSSTKKPVVTTVAIPRPTVTAAPATTQPTIPPTSTTKPRKRHDHHKPGP
ncbi:MAG TPA: hypothetical protein VIK61_08685 [Acidimicrobiia bacterium]